MTTPKVKYFYDYPDQRLLGKCLSPAERRIIAEKTGYTYDYVNRWCQGIRRNEVIRKAAELMMEVSEFRERMGKEIQCVNEAIITPAL